MLLYGIIFLLIGVAGFAYSHLQIKTHFEKRGELSEEYRYSVFFRERIGSVVFIISGVVMILLHFTGVGS